MHNHEHHNNHNSMNHHSHDESKEMRHDDHNEDSRHDKHAGHSVENFKKKLYVSLIVTIPILLLSPFIQELLKISIQFPGDKWILFLLSSFVFFYGGSPFLIGALREIRHGALGMMTLISLAIVVAYLYSSAVTMGFMGEVFFWELATLIDIMLLGHWLEMKSIMGASRALEKLSQLIPDIAYLKKGDGIMDVSVNEIKQGDVVLVKPGEKIPIDGVIIKGESFVNESMLTGESKPVEKKIKSKVIGGSIVEEGSLEIKVEEVGDKTYLSKVIGLVKNAQASKSKTQLLADKAAFWLTLISITIGVITFATWLILGKDIVFAIERTATVLIIACPHALGLAVPLVVAISTTVSAQNGLLIKNRTAFENARRITTIIFDKTGTLTEGTFDVKKIIVLDNNYSEEKILQIVSALEKNSEHPIGKAIMREVGNRKLALLEVDKFKAIKGKGIEGVINNVKNIVASPGYLVEIGINKSEEVEKLEGTNIYLISQKEEKFELIGAINLSDTIRKESYDAIRLLKKENIKLWMITGDNENSAKSVSDELKLDGYFAQVLPHEKQEKVKKLQGKEEFVAMVGDGINDAPALAQADVGIAIGSGTDIAAETADIILVNSNPRDIASLVIFGKSTYKKMVQNLWWATGYNVVAIPLAAGVLASYGILLSPALGAIFMSLSTVIVAINAKMLKVNK
ncbi:MAG: copper-translocating P-type ATPase [Candidatus Moranbacteria bacterium GW2011_GWF2_34_56]|nr:MAG: copper-translocating P-type ATPase [Candidatus Moranbacteria bacterium GW2011_GWF1_34_10]KKP64445.1 MAG: copper-translocating P-type ATPase [Candidatus Moranbacteria bacterium GW2011_GWF2_34_56]HBI17093.1 cadmium-translocating P-type ATPase [Candidatus Moranbacteria bacterium]